MAVFIGTWLAAVAVADIEWTGEANAVLGPDNADDINEASFTTPLVGHFNDSTVGYFIQLLRACANGVIDAIPATVSSEAELQINFAAQGDDEVVSTRWMGAGFAGHGLWVGAAWADANDGATENYFVRTWVG
ncbi:MAG: hypothetical protein VCG02_18680, partial [Verrucomicrobiota bacterium]